MYRTPFVGSILRNKMAFGNPAFFENAARDRVFLRRELKVVQDISLTCRETLNAEYFNALLFALVGASAIELFFFGMSRVRSRAITHREERGSSRPRSPLLVDVEESRSYGLSAGETQARRTHSLPCRTVDFAQKQFRAERLHVKEALRPMAE